LADDCVAAIAETGNKAAVSDIVMLIIRIHDNAFFHILAALIGMVVLFISFPPVMEWLDLYYNLSVYVDSPSWRVSRQTTCLADIQRILNWNISFPSRIPVPSVIRTGMPGGIILSST
jgi:hypothetical protein